MGGFWLWFEIIGTVMLAGIPLVIVIAFALRRAARKVEAILAEELDSPEDHDRPTPSGDNADHHSRSV
ncbi:MAG TPA: hypothetical protein VJT49_17525 [Amycolatopsis sp.]|uniref:hypothetical protein n=1 Tax=Amycolatopsis sp. TaxID=37632 RepID=UPI002B4614F7|nr:hypothetical protein [Amycolatopsis sp.]HKS46871.1 hypothetical protein [Amycolatopsis sp.]